jgi:hypothetical protein
VSEASFFFPNDTYVESTKAFWKEINGPNRSNPPKKWVSNNWWATTHCSQGTKLEKTGVARICLQDGKIGGENANMSFFETVSYPQSPLTPGMIIMAVTTEKANIPMHMLYIDLFRQRDNNDVAATQFKGIIEKIYHKHQWDFQEHNEFLPGMDLLGGNGIGCGIFGLYVEEDIQFFDELVHGALTAYKEILNNDRGKPTTPSDYEQMGRNRGFIEPWIKSEDMGYKILFENHIPEAILESYLYPPTGK